MEDTRITFETAKLAKEKGFKWKSKKGYLENGSLGVSHYSDYCENDNEDYPTKFSAPTQSLLAKWLREEHEIDILVQRAFSNGIKKYILTPCFDKPIVKGYQSVEKNNYEEAYEIGLQEALKLI